MCLKKTFYIFRKIFKTFLVIVAFSIIIFSIVLLSIASSHTATIFDRQSGGYDIIAESSIPLSNLDMNNTDITYVKTVGERGATCSNIYKNLPPKLLGVDDSFLHENKFKFRSQSRWEQLKSSSIDEPIPVVGDYNTIVWVYGRDVGDTITIIDEYSRTRELQIVGILDTSVFSGTLLMCEKNLDKLYPTLAQYRYFLIKLKTTSENRKFVAYQLELKYAEYGLSATLVHDIIRNSIETENTYIRSFQILLYLGLVMGCAGLGIVLIRFSIERRYEIGVLRAIGFTKRSLLKKFLNEVSIISGVSIFIGVVVGIVCAIHALSNVCIPWFKIFVIGFLTYLCAIVCVLYPAIKTAKLAPADALRFIE
jgi:ABC-type antimicrobial peptide transport system permease subunit